MNNGIDKLIINSAYREPEQHWRYSLDAQSFERVAGRRPAGYFVAGQGSNAYNDIGKFIELELANKIRPRVKAWRLAGYAGVTGVTRKLLEHWNDKDMRQHQFFWCQLDAMETLIWLTEAPEAERVGVYIPGDGGPFKRLCTKLCTGGGKTTVMAMLIAWQVCNKAAYPRDTRFSKDVFIVAPGLTVKSRLQVLLTGGEDNYYARFGVVPAGLTERLRQGRVVINNWQALAWESSESIAKKKGVDKRGAKSDEAYAREALLGLASARNILVINDEAHHAWRKNPEIKVKLNKEEKEAEREATIWVGGLDRIQKARGILACYDFSATPFAPSGKKNDEEALFGWIVSDFGLNDGIESGLVKTPRVVARDDLIPVLDKDKKDYKPRLYHIYMDKEVRDGINRSSLPAEPLPPLLNSAYSLLSADWFETFKAWRDAGKVVPPVMITVANRTETAARIHHAFTHKRIPLPVDELCDPDLTLRIDSITVEEDAKSKEDIKLREKVDTIGQIGMPGEQIRNVISVQMLSEGWDAKTVTHIMGLRAFSSQLLCEQVVGRGLRRTSYETEDDGLFAPEYVNIFGIPFTFLPHEDGDDGVPKPPKPTTQVEPRSDRADYAITFPNVARIDCVPRPILVLNMDIKKIKTLTLDTSDTCLRADLAPILDGKTDYEKFTEIDIEKLIRDLRMQWVIFETAARVYDLLDASWKGNGTKPALIGQVIRLVEKYIDCGAIEINPPLFNTGTPRQRIILMLNMDRIVYHLWEHINIEYTDRYELVFGDGKKIRSTADMATWYTTKPCNITQHSHISHCVYDSTWESAEAYALEKNPHVAAWVKNDHLGFEVTYRFDGVVRKYYPDFLIRLTNGKMLILETKGQETELSKAKHEALKVWVAAANEAGEYGEWCCDVSYDVRDVDGVIGKWL